MAVFTLTEPLAPVANQDPIDKWRAEFDGYYQEMKDFSEFESDQVFLKLAAWSARASEIRSHLVRQESRKMQAFRTREIDPFLEEVDRQFKFFSRIQSVKEMDLKLQGSVI